jgi:excisionase family DNA binding protein
MSDNIAVGATFSSTLAPPQTRICKSGCIPPSSPLVAPPGGQSQAGGEGIGERFTLTTRQAATYLGVSPRTLEDWRFRGGGPVFRKIGRRIVRYQRTDLDAFLEHSARVNTGGGRPA